MKYLSSQLQFFLQDRRTQRKIWSLVKFVLLLLMFIVVYSVLFHVLMEMEGQHHSWVTGFYWTLTVMSTLGFGDITFISDVGKIFSIVVLFSGIVFLLVMLPFTFIQFFYAPYLEAQSKSRVPRKVPEDVSGHLIVTGVESVVLGLVNRLKHFGHPCFILVPDVQRGLDLMDQDYRVVVGQADDPETFVRMRVREAAMVLILDQDMKNTSIVFTVREVAPDVPIVANAEMEESVDILQLAGASHVFQFMKELGGILARRTIGASTLSNVIGRFDNLLIAEVPAMRTPVAGKTILECGLREATGMNVVGVWERGMVHAPKAQTVIRADSVLILAGTREQLDAYDRFAGGHDALEAPVLILGGGRVGRAASEALAERGVDYRVVEKRRTGIGPEDRYIIGNASDYDTLVQAGIEKAPSVLVTTHTDELNIFLTIYCRRLRPDTQIISRATQDRSITLMHKAGADLVMSYATLVANTVINLLSPGKVLMLTEGLNIFKARVHPSLVDKTLADSGIRQDTRCNIIAIKSAAGLAAIPEPNVRLKSDSELILVGTAEAERRYMEKYPG